MSVAKDRNAIQVAIMALNGWDRVGDGGFGGGTTMAWHVEYHTLELLFIVYGPCRV